MENVLEIYKLYQTLFLDEEIEKVYGKSSEKYPKHEDFAKKHFLALVKSNPNNLSILQKARLFILRNSNQ